jgi:hypothetical protein
MVTKSLALTRFREEEQYEERLADQIISYYIACLNLIEDINDSEREKILQYLELIKKESVHHKRMLLRIIGEIEANGKDYY